MLFISILLAVWFVCWLYMQKFNHDTGCLTVEMLNYMIFGDEEDSEESEEDKSEEDEEEPKTVYRCVCPKCSHEWYSTEENVAFCPKCGEKCEWDELEAE